MSGFLRCGVDEQLCANPRRGLIALGRPRISKGRDARRACPGSRRDVPRPPSVGLTALILVALLPFAALGITLGHLVNVESVGPLTGGLLAIPAFRSGTWFPLTHGFLYDVGQYLPGYWLVQSSHIAIHGHAWGTEGRAGNTERV
jgi:hypothetical protein